MRLTANADGTPSDRDLAIAVLRRAVELGVNHIDTAAFYFSALRSANELINRALAPYPDDLVITTKVWPGRDASGHWFPATPQQLRGQVEENLRQLGRDHLDVVNLRNMNRVWTDSIAEHFGALAQLREAGLIRHLGVSNVSPDHLAEAQAIAPVVCVQNRYGIGARRPDADEFLRACGAQGIAFVPFFAIAGPAARPVRATPTARRSSPSHAPTERRGPGQAGLDAAARTARACHPWYRQSGAPDRQPGRRDAAADRGRTGQARVRRPGRSLTRPAPQAEIRAGGQPAFDGQARGDAVCSQPSPTPRSLPARPGRSRLTGG